MRAMFSKISVLVLATGLAGSAVVGGCSSTPDNKTLGADQGSVGFQLDVGGGATINTMHVIVYGNSLGALGASTNIIKDLDVGAITGSVATFSLTLPKGINYQVALSTPENATCAGTGTFNVIAAQASTIGVTMSCASTDITGDTNVNATACTPPVVNSVFVGPDTQAVGHVIGLDAIVESGSTIQWTSSGVGTGTFGSSTTASTGFTCTGAGAVSLQLGLAKNGCTTTKSYSVTCVGGSTGTGGAGGAGGAAAGGAPAGGAPAGGAPAGGAPAGGAPAGGAPAGGAPAGGAPAGGAPAGGAPAGGAPAGGAPAGGAPAGGSANGGGGATGGTGGVIGSGGSGGSLVCPNAVDNENGTGQVCTAAFTVDECGANCQQITTDACQACEHADTSACYDDGDPTDGSSLLNMAAAITFYGGVASPARVQAGIAAEACIYSTGCANNAPVFTGCYCGTSGSACTSPGAANGPCKAQLEAALDTTSPAVIGTNIGDPSFGGGVAQVRIACDKTQCRSACIH